MCIDIDIIVINWNSGILTVQAVAPYLNFQNEFISCNVIIVDNGSVDNSIEYLEKKVPQLIKCDKNVGFGSACNLAFKLCKGKYILLLNPDTISGISVLQELVFFLEANKNFGTVGPAQFDKRNVIMRTCARFPTFTNSFYELLGLSKLLPKIFIPNYIMKDWDHSESKIVDHVMGSYLLIRRSILNNIGFMDEDYFVYLEDIDLSKRIYDAGYKSFYNANLSIYHEGGGTGYKVDEFRLFYFISSRRIYWKKHFSNPACSILTVLSLISEPILRIFQSVIGQNDISIKHIFIAYKMYLNSIFKFYRST